MFDAPIDKEISNTGYWAGYVRRMRGDSSSGGGAAVPPAPGRLQEPPATTVLSPPPAAKSGAAGLSSAKSAPLRESSGRTSDIYSRPEWDPCFTSTCSFRGRASVSPRPAPLAEGRSARPGSATTPLAATARAAAAGRTASPGPRPLTASQRLPRPATQRDRRHSVGHEDDGAGGSTVRSPASGVRGHTHNPRELAALAGIYRQQQARAMSPGPQGGAGGRPGTVGNNASPGRGGRYASPGPSARYTSPASPALMRGRCSSPTPGRPHPRTAAAATAAPVALSDPGVDILFAECTSKLQHLEYSALLLLMAAREAKGRPNSTHGEDGDAPVHLPDAEFDREAAKEAWNVLKHHQAACAQRAATQRWSLQQSSAGGGDSSSSGGGSGGDTATASGSGGLSGGGSSTAAGSDGGSSKSAAGLLRQRYIASES